MPLSIKSLAAFSGIVTVGFMLHKYVLPRLSDILNRKRSRIYVCNNASSWYSNERYFLKKIYEAKLIGLDCEWVSFDHRNPIALVQIATADGFCVLIRLCNFTIEEIPENLILLLSDTSILKLGVGIHDDARKLCIDYGLVVSGRIDLRHLVKNDPTFNDKKLGLKSLALEILGLSMKKDLARTNWEAPELTSQQIFYAAQDAIVAAQIFIELCKQTGSNTEFFRLEFDHLIDVPFKMKDQSPSKPQNNTTSKANHTISFKNFSFHSGLLRKKPMYENCQLQAPDGELLCCCNRKKANWYLEKGRGVVVTEDPFTVRLNFEPSGRPILDNMYYVLGKDDCCVVCGVTKCLLRKQVVPSEYRKHFPFLMKKFVSHDVLLLCIICHRKCAIFDKQLKDELAKKCNAPIETLKIISNRQLSGVKSAAKALIHARDKIPVHRREELEKILCEHFEVDSVTEDVLSKANDLFTYDPNIDYKPHGLKVYEYFCQNGGLIQLEICWRQHFLDHMNPQFLPAMWSVDHNHERLAFLVIKRGIDFDVSILGLSEEMLNAAHKEMLEKESK